MQVIIGSLITLALALALTPLVRGIARRTGAVAAPRADRRHQQPTALLGRVAIYLAFAIGCSFFAWQTSGARLILAAGTLLFIVGLVDDLIQVKPYTKLIVQLFVAALVVYFSRRLHWTYVEPLNIFITIFWLVGITN